MFKDKTKLITTIAFVLGVCCLLYPFVSDFLNKRQLADIVNTQNFKVEEVIKKDSGRLDLEKDRAYRYNKSLRSSMSIVTDPFDPNRDVTAPHDYNKILNLANDGVMGTIIIPSIKVELPIYHSVEEEVLQKGVGHIDNTSLPIGGDTSHCVLTGHTGLPAVKIFDKLDQMKVGDIFLIKVLDETHAYKVYDIEDVLPEDTKSLAIEDEKDLCTLVTCTPYGVNTRRLLVHGKRCEVPEKYKESNIGMKSGLPSYLQEQKDHVMIYSVIGVLVGVGLVKFYLAKQKKEDPTSHEPLHLK